MTGNVKNQVRDAILAQVSELQSAMAKFGVERATDSFLTIDGIAGLQGTIFHGPENPVPDARFKPFGPVPSGIYLDEDDEMLVHDYPGHADMATAFEQVFENLVDFADMTGGFEIINQFDVTIPAVGAPEYRIEISKTSDEEWVDWQIPLSEPESAPAVM